MEAYTVRLGPVTLPSGALEGPRWRAAIGVAVAVAFWWGLSRLDAAALPSPLTVARVLIAEVMSGELQRNVAVSLARVLAGFALGSAAGLLVGGLIGWSWLVRAMLWPFIEVTRLVPPLAWVPVAILWFGIDEGSKVFIVALGAFFPTLLSTASAVRDFESVYVRAARTLGAPASTVFFRVVLPGVLPDIFTGFRMGWALGLISLVAAELIAARSGLGYMLTSARLSDRLDVILATVITIGALGLASEWVLRLVGRRLLAWHVGLERLVE